LGHGEIDIDAGIDGFCYVLKSWNWCAGVLETGLIYLGFFGGSFSAPPHTPRTCVDHRVAGKIHLLILCTGSFVVYLREYAFELNAIMIFNIESVF
jgi:hypothetical protein